VCAGLSSRQLRSDAGEGRITNLGIQRGSVLKDTCSKITLWRGCTLLALLTPITYERLVRRALALVATHIDVLMSMLMKALGLLRTMAPSAVLHEF
jgi:hypothetical protein